MGIMKTATAVVSKISTEVLADAEASAKRTPQFVRDELTRIGDQNAFAFGHQGEIEVFDFRRSANSHLQATMVRCMSEAIGAQDAQRLGHVYPLDLIVKNLPRWQNAMRRYGYHADDFDEDGDPVSEGNKSQQLLLMLSLMESKVKLLRDAVMRNVANGEIAFEDLPIYFTRGNAISCRDRHGQIIAGNIVASEIISGWMGDYLQVVAEVVHAIHGRMAVGNYTMTFNAYGGLRKLSELPMKLLDDADKAKLAERGRKYVKIATGAHYLSYTGHLSRTSWWSTETFRADGRVMVDTSSFQRIDSDQFNNEVRQSGLKNNNSQNEAAPEYQPSEKDLWRTWPYVFGFSFRAKRWGRLVVEQLSEIDWRDDAYDKLVLPDDQKKMVRALVEHSDGSFQDLIEGKGGGCIFLLHGPPGQGKTLTAETIAELLRKPLYAISVGELGVTPDELEQRLRTILDVATVWGAVILLDEADIYLEARDEKDIVRNAMVGVFLRLLEYHQGVLFLTTNRVKNIDTAFYSRISVALHFDKSDNAKREKIWSNLLTSAGISGINPHDLASIDINGRQIKNAIRLAQTLAKSESKQVDLEGLRKVIELMTEFDKDANQ